jgi:hypothetical protein
MKPLAIMRLKKSDINNRTPEYYEKINEGLQRALAQRAFQQQLAVRRAYHEKILNMMVDPEFAVKIRLQALQRISVWRDEQTCSEFYCRTWENILAMPSIDAMKEAVLLDKNWSNTLQQNSPISGWNLEGAE